MAQTAFKLSGFPATGSSAWPACWIPPASVLSSPRTQCERGEHHCLCAWRSRRHHGAFARAILPWPEFPLPDLMYDGQPSHAIVQRTRDGGADIVKYLKTGSAFFRSLRCRRRNGRGHPERQAENFALRGLSGWRVRDQRTCLSACRAKLGARGIEQIIEIKLLPDEQAALEKSAGAVKELVAVIGV